MRHRKTTTFDYLRTRVGDVIHWVRGTEAPECPSWEAGGVIAHHRRAAERAGWIKPEDLDE